MKLFEKLKAELQNVPSGVYSPLYLRSLGARYTIDKTNEAFDDAKKNIGVKTLLVK